VGTGIGGGAILGNQLAHGLVHPEMGHLFIPQDKNQDPYPGICPYHGNCLEGLASGPAIKDRWQVKSALDLPADHPAWPLEAHYLAFAVANYIMTLSPKRIIMGGGVMAQQQLFPLIRTKVLEHLNGYIDHPSLLQAIDEYIVAPGLGSKSGVYGAIALAKQAYSASSNLPA
jgi:fructokinase